MLKAYIPHKISVGETQSLSDKESRVISANQTILVEDPITLLSHSGSYLGKIVYIEKGFVEVEVIQKLSEQNKESFEMNQVEPEFRVLQTILTKEPMSYAIEKLSEIGVEVVEPVFTQFAEKPIELSKSYQSWERIASESKAQSYRQNAIQVSKPISITKVIFFKNELKLCLSVENIEKQTLSKVFSQGDDRKTYKKITLAIGPSEGWSTNELNFFKDNGFIMVTLGDTILRAETAGLVAVSAIKFHFGLL